MQIHATLKEILSCSTTDIYFHRAEEILKKENKNPEVVVEVWAKNFPDNYPWCLFAGLGEVIDLLKGKEVDLWALPEGSLFLEREPVMTIKGKYLEFGSLETPLLGYICQASGISTKAARCKIAAGERAILSFGARRMHPSITPVIDRYAYLGGVDGVSAILSGERLGIKSKGTIPHSVILILGDTKAAALAYDRAIPEGIPRIILVDTFRDEKVDALRVANALKERLDAVRIDTPSSRRGDLALIAQEIRGELDLRGYKDVGIFASGGIDEKEIVKLNPWVNGYGVGTSLSNAPTINFSLDIVEIQGKPVAKKGKTAGRKEVYECRKCGKRKISFHKDPGKRCECGNEMDLLTKKIMEKGRLTVEMETPDEIRKRVLNRLRFLDV
ncbi:MAG: nicotinate phosphoribosyltransferase [candidate division WOR-3 bacterium]|nr:nicotinate phosphoribosyltransferase [candidate division WOR-3 bacterium]